MRSRISKALRDLVMLRAGNRCEYCRVPQALSNFDFHIEHIISIQHGGESHQMNLAYCCSFCNWKKGTNLATLVGSSMELVPLYNPRVQNWFEHFKSVNGWIQPLTPIGEATAKLLEFNLPERVEIRAVLSLSVFYP